MTINFGRQYLGAIAVLLATVVSVPGLAAPAVFSHIKTVFVIVMENRNWTGGTVSLKDNPSAPYINNTLVPLASHAEQYYNPPGNHPSLPNYFWLEAGTNFGVLANGLPSHYGQHTKHHLTAQLDKAGISWKAYVENISGRTCPLTNSNRKDPDGHADYYAVVDPFVYFDDVTNRQRRRSAACISHIRPFGELAQDLASGHVAQYNWITPNLCHDMHDPCGGDQVDHGDKWLAKTVPMIVNSGVFRAGGALFITWDEAHSGDGPVPMFVISPFAKGGGYSNTIHYTHGSTLRTIEEIFGVRPLLGDSANQTDLRDLFTRVR